MSTIKAYVLFLLNRRHRHCRRMQTLWMTDLFCCARQTSTRLVFICHGLARISPSWGTSRRSTSVSARPDLSNRTITGDTTNLFTSYSAYSLARAVWVRIVYWDLYAYILLIHIDVNFLIFHGLKKYKRKVYCSENWHPQNDVVVDCRYWNGSSSLTSLLSWSFWAVRT